MAFLTIHVSPSLYQVQIDEERFSASQAIFVSGLFAR